MTVEPASTLDLTSLREVFNEGFSDYLVPLQLDEVAFRDHVDGNDIDLDCSQVAIDDRPAAVALIARRGAAGWVGGMATAPSYRRRGLGELALLAGRDDADPVTTLQIAAVDDDAAADALLAAAGRDRGLRLSNAPVGEAPARALARLDARPLVRQREMRLAL